MLRHAIVSDKPGGLSVQRPPSPTKIGSPVKTQVAQAHYESPEQHYPT